MPANESLRTLSTLLTFLLLCRCGPDRKADPNEERASIVLLRETSDPSDPDEPDAVGREVVCGAVAVAPRLAVTAAHCVEGQTAILAVTHSDWWGTGSRSQVAAVESVTGELARLTLERDADAWVEAASPADGGAVLVRRFESSDVQLAGLHVDAPLEHGDSGSGVFEGGKLVAIVQACDSDDGATCLPTGGRVSEAGQ